MKTVGMTSPKAFRLTRTPIPLEALFDPIANWQYVPDRFHLIKRLLKLRNNLFVLDSLCLQGSFRLPMPGHFLFPRLVHSGYRGALLLHRLFKLRIVIF